MSQETAPAHPHINPWIIAISVMLSTFMEVLDTTVVNVSLPHIAGSLSVTVDEATWTLTSYLVANAIILPLTGWLSNFFGRKRMLMLSVTGFTIASFLCGLAPSLPFLVVCRIIQGACGGGLQPISQAILLESFPPEDRGKAMGFWGLGIVVAPMLGPVLGGWLTDSHSWRWVFYINVPIGVASIVMTSLFIYDPSYIRRASQKIDYWGIGLLAVGIATLQIVLDKGQEKDWFGTDWITAVAIVAVVTLVAFLIYELHIKDPVVNLRVFKDRTYSSGVFLMSLL
ncbi:MAG TPA: DHA2 family efflux MFS transporter permease subunit, partial [Candidatus Acidoferrum sp.]|nr:DHA2 family efflux MFS transporter permease subunit [Candidatus Acidoferrum sp.]